MERLKKSAKTADDVNRVLKESDLFRDVGLSGPVSLTEALRMDMSCLAETPATIGCPSTAWWWFVEDFYRPIGRHDMLKLLPQADELDPSSDRFFRMPPLGPPEGRRTLTECWESFGYTTLRKERRSGRLAEKRAFSSGHEVPSAPGADWLELPKDFLKTHKNALELCKDESIVGQLDELLNDLDVTSSTEKSESSQFIRYQTIHPLTEMMLDQAKNDDRMDISEDDNPSQGPDHPFSSQCLSIGPDDEIVAEILKLQDNLFGQMVTNRIMARRLSKAALRSSKREQKEALMREQKENEIVKCMKIIEAHEKKKSEKRAAEKAESKPPVESPSILKKEAKEVKPLTLPPQDQSQCKPLSTKPPPAPTVIPSPSKVDKKTLKEEVEEVKSGACEVCGASDSVSNLLVCEHCGIAVHQNCYPNAKSPVSESSNWYCLPCQIYHERQKGIPMKSTALKSGGALSVECKVCLKSGGAFERTTDNKWIHSVCQLAITEGNLTGSVQTRRKCTLCEKAKGKVLPCTRKNCTSFLHPSCAKEKGTLVIKRKKQKNNKTTLVIESMTCGQCKIVEPKRIPQEAPSGMSEQGVQDQRSLISGTKKKRRLLPKSESMLNEEAVASDDEAKESVSRSTRSKTKPIKTEVSLPPPLTEIKATRPQKKTDSSSVPPHSKKIKKIKKSHQTSITGKHLQSTLPEETKSALPNLDKNKKYRITRSRK